MEIATNDLWGKSSGRNTQIKATISITRKRLIFLIDSSSTLRMAFDFENGVWPRDPELRQGRISSLDFRAVTDLELIRL